MKQQFVMPTGELAERDYPLWKTPYNHDRDFESERTATFIDDEPLTKQEFKDETDINVIMQRVLRTGEAPPMALPENFLDLSGRTTYFEMASQVAEANRLFYELPADQRAKHLNDPTRWADAVVRATELGDEAKLKELGVDVTERPLAANPGTPSQGGSPAPGTSQTPPAAPASGAPAGGATPANVTPPI